MAYPPQYPQQPYGHPRPPGPGVDPRALPPIAPQPRELKLGLVLLGVSTALQLIGQVWRVIEMLVANDPDSGSRGLLRIVVYILGALIMCGLIGLLAHFLWRGSQVAVWLAIALAGLFGLSVLMTGFGFVAALARGGSSGMSPRGFLLLVASLVGVASLLGFANRATMRWSRRTEAIRSVRTRVERGIPVHRLPPAIYE